MRDHTTSSATAVAPRPAVRSLAIALSEVDARLLGLCWWRAHQLRATLHAPPGRRATCRARVLDKYGHDRDVLLDLRSWLHGCRS